MDKVMEQITQDFLDDEEMNNVSAEYRNYINNFTKDNGELSSKKDVVKKISSTVENEDEDEHEKSIGSIDGTGYGSWSDGRMRQRRR